MLFYSICSYLEMWYLQVDIHVINDSTNIFVASIFPIILCTLIRLMPAHSIASIKRANQLASNTQRQVRTETKVHATGIPRILHIRVTYGRDGCQIGLINWINECIHATHVCMRGVSSGSWLVNDACQGGWEYLYSYLPPRLRLALRHLVMGISKFNDAIFFVKSLRWYFERFQGPTFSMVLHIFST